MSDTDTPIDPLVILLSRLSRDVLDPAERDLLRAHVDQLTSRVTELEADIDMVRRLCTLTITTSVRRHAVQQARCTLAILNNQPTTETTP